MNVVRGFLTDPDVLFLDEPTLGLDVGAARDIRMFIHRWMREHPERTVLLTTHYMIEADELCDRVAIINAGRVLTCDAPGRLKQGLRRHPIFTLETAVLQEPQLAYLASVPPQREQKSAAWALNTRTRGWRSVNSGIALSRQSARARAHYRQGEGGCQPSGLSAPVASLTPATLVTIICYQLTVPWLTR